MNVGRGAFFHIGVRWPRSKAQVGVRPWGIKGISNVCQSHFKPAVNPQTSLMYRLKGKGWVPRRSAGNNVGETSSLEKRAQGFVGRVPGLRTAIILKVDDDHGTSMYRPRDIGQFVSC